ncbi:DUF1415 domain-containing protein [Salinimonas marina]|uniref:DUF1415 domain-containing protein n=1 Tax=Salinimonas marina TaxID=2785918 RepID=A0A7S9DZF1_9ALTE|nr:DUF1415 domain-containing protein [Salinimonas marina]QPG06483.1 DUF1415 domain-containing protein [Salinimonas marina]
MKSLQRNTEEYIQATRQWIDQVVIGHNFCPFARFVRSPETIHYAVNAAYQAEDIMLALHAECQRLDNTPDIATTLLILPGLKQFDRYLDVLELAQVMLEQWHYEGVYQLASFHPHYQFEGEAADAPSNYTNRSPYPVLHLLRETDITRVMADYEDPHSIFENNMAETEKQGCAHFEQLLQQCKKPR